jgi:hypothetical protein
MVGWPVPLTPRDDDAKGTPPRYSCPRWTATGRLAKTIGRPQSFISEYERGQRRLDLVELREVCVACSTTLRKLVNEYERRLESLTS